MYSKISLFLLLPIFAFSQSPQKINFQSILRNTNGEVVANKSVSLKISILSGSIKGNSVYSETHNKTTDPSGLLSLQIGNGTVLSGVFANIGWGNAPHFIKLEVDFSGENNYVLLGTQELMSVPYALYASKTDTSSLNLVNRFSTKLNGTDTISLSNRIDTKSSLSDTSLLNLANRFSSKLNGTDTASLSNRIDTKSSLSDTSLLNLTSRFSTKLNVTDTAFLSNRIDTKLNKTDTSLLNLTSRLATKLNVTDTASLSNRIDAKSSLSDTSLLDLANRFSTKLNLTDTAFLSNRIDIKLNKTDTSLLNLTSRFSTKLNVTDTASLSNRINTKSSLSDTSLLNLTSRFAAKLNVTDTASLSNRIDTKLNKTDTSLLDLANRFSSKVNLSDTSNMLTNYRIGLNNKVNISDTSDMLNPYLRKADAIVSVETDPVFNTSVAKGITGIDTAYWNRKLNLSDTSNMLSNYRTGLNNKVNFSDTANMLANYKAMITDLQKQLELLSALTAPLDIDGNKYHVVKIGDQIWMKENLRVSRYNNGDSIPTGFNNADWINTTNGAYAIYNNPYSIYNSDSTNNAIFGKLYNWYAVNDSRKLCPVGWHVPSDAEFTTLTTYLGGESVAGGKMKSISSHWNGPNIGANNESGFSALPGGNRQGSDGFFNVTLGLGFFWSSTQDNNGNSWYRMLTEWMNDVSRLNSRNYSFGHSIRCIKD